MDKCKMESKNVINENIKKIEEVFPCCITEGVDSEGAIVKKVNIKRLMELLSLNQEETDETYEMSWVGKKAAIIEANKSTQKTLRPCILESKDWNDTENIYVEGDNLDVLKLLQESYLGKIKMIYIDPPYNTGNDFIYRDNFYQTTEEYQEQLGVIEEDAGIRLYRNTDTNGRFHSDWCSMMYSRLMLARNLLAEDGIIFISIDDNEVDNLKKICNEIFGESNFVANLIWQSTAGSNTGTDIVTVTEYILVFTKKRSVFNFDGMLPNEDSYSLIDEYESTRGRYSLDKLDRRRVGSHYSDSLNYPIQMPDGTLRYPGGGSTKSAEGWNYLWSKSKVEWGIREGFIVFSKTNGNWNVYNKRYAKVDNNGNYTERTIPFRNLITSDKCNTAQGTAEIRNLFGLRPFDFPKPSGLIKYLLSTAVRSDKNAIVMDFFSGSATTADAVMQMNADDSGHRKYILVQVPERTDKNSEGYKAGYATICEIGKERIRRAGKKIKEENPQATDLDTGFRVFKLDDSNMKDVYYSAGEYSQSMLAGLESNIKEDRTDLDLFFGCLLDWGLPLSLPYTSEEIDGCTVHTYNEGDLIACFDENIPESVIKAIAKRQPLRAVFRDSSFEGSPEKINVGEIFKLLAPDTRIRVI